jgi:branched-chain amino acid transport system substrate-binding protein
MRAMRTRRIAVALAALAMVATACGGGDGENAVDEDADPAATSNETGGESEGGDNGGSASVADAPESGVTADTIKIGWMGDVTGPTASAQVGNLRGIEAYVEKVNSEGGVLGRDLELIVKDDEYGAEAGVANFQALVNDDQVLAINQIGGGQIMDAIMADAERFGVPLVSVAQTTTSSMSSDYAFHTIAHYFDQADVAVARMIDAVGSAEDLKAAVVQLEVPSGDEWNAGIEKAIEEQGGEYMGRVTINVAQPDAGTFASEVSQLMDQGTNYLAIHVAPAQALFVVNTLASNNLDIPVVGMQGVASQNVYQEGNEAQLEQTEGTHSFLTYADESEGGAEIEEFINGEGSKFAEDAKHINFTHGWLGGMIIHQAIERAAEESGELTRETFHQALQGPIDTKGLTCDIDWSEPPFINPCAAPFSSDGEQMRIVGSFEEWAESITAEYPEL